MPASRRGVSAARRRPRAALASPHRSAAHAPRSILAASLSASAFGRGASCPQVDPHARKPPHPVAPPASSPALLIPAQASRPKTPPSFPASPRIFASARPQTLRKPRQPAARTASATCPARLVAPAPRPPEPATPAPRYSSAPTAAHVLIASSLRCRRPSSRRSARLGRSPSRLVLKTC